MSGMQLERLWITREEDITIEIDGKKVSRRTSMGIGTKGDGSLSSDDMYKIADKTLNRLFVEEYEKYLNKDKIKERIDILNGPKATE